MPFPNGADYNAEYAPQGGFGGFHARFVPGTGALTVTTRIRITWQNDKGPWDPAKQLAFRTKMLAKIPEAWDSKWRFRCTTAGFGGVIATPAIDLQVVNDGTEHFNFICHNTHGQAYLHAGQNTVHLFENDVLSMDKQPGAARTVGMSSGGVMGSERRKVEQILVPVQNITVQRGTPWTVAVGSQAALTLFAQNLNRIDPHAPKYPLVIEATSGIAAKAQAMVDAVGNFLTAQGVNNYPIRRSPATGSRKFKNIFTHTPKPTGTVTIRLDNDDNTVRANWLYRYKVAVHEFGHCLGLPDEYQDNYPALGTRAHDEWRRLCTAANVPSRPVPKFDASIMSCGWQTFGCHYVTIWDALCALTAGLVAPNEWLVERGTQLDVL
jgi:hypothetical protein